MKKTFIFFLIVAALIAVVIMCYYVKREKLTQCRALLSDSYFLNKKQIKKQKALANQGDGAAAHTLYWYYASYEADNDLSMYWLIRAAEYNDCVAQYNLAGIYLDMYHNKELASFWYTRALENGICERKDVSDSDIEYIKRHTKPSSRK
jgi:hypothetical protein